MPRIAGSAEHGWVWSDAKGLHVREHLFDRFHNYLIVGGTSIVVARKKNLDHTSVLVVQVALEPPVVTAYVLNSTDRMDIDVSDTHVFIASRAGLDVRTLPDFSFYNIWPGSFCAVSVLPNHMVAVANMAGTVAYLNMADHRWEPTSYAVYVEDTMPNHRLMLTFSNPWCPRHKHSLEQHFHQHTVAGSCNGVTPTYVSLIAQGPLSLYMLYHGKQPICRFRASDVDLREDNLIVRLHNCISVWAPPFWGCRLAMLYQANLPLLLIKTMKKILAA